MSFFLASILIVLSILACLFSPAVLAFAKAGVEDGFTLDAFNYGPSPWWQAGIFLLVLGFLALLAIISKILKAAGGRMD